jgi:DNA anti-recombination protein RmuC
MKAEISSVKADIKAEISSVKQDLCSVKADIGKVQADINSVRSDLKAEQEKLVERFEKQRQEDRKEFAAHLDSESRRLTNLVGKLQKETESELVIARKQIQATGTEFESQLRQSQTNTQILINELTDRISDYRSEVDANISRLGQEVSNKLTSQKESFEEISDAATQEKSAVDRKLEQFGAKLELLDNKISQLPNGQTVAADASAIGHGTISPSVLHLNNQSPDSHPGTAESVNVCRMNETNEQVSVTSFLSSAELPLPTFHENLDTHPVYHLTRLDEFIQFRSVPKALQLAIACRSMVGQMSKQ